MMSAPISWITFAVIRVATSLTVSILRSSEPIQSVRPLATTSRPPLPRFTRWPRFWRKITNSPPSSFLSMPSFFMRWMILFLSSGLYSALLRIAFISAWFARASAPSARVSPFMARARRNRFSTLYDASFMASPFNRFTNGLARTYARAICPFLLFAGIVSRVDVIDRPRPNTMDLKDSLFLGPGTMVHLRLHNRHAAGRYRLGLAGIELVSHADVKGAGDHSYVLDRGVRVRRKVEAPARQSIEDQTP